MVSLEEDSLESVESIIGNDSLIHWPATRGPSLDDEEETAQIASKMHTPFLNEFTQSHPPRWASIEDDEDLSEFMKMMAKEEDDTVAVQPFQWPATRGPSLDEFAGASMVLNLESQTMAKQEQEDAVATQAFQWPATQGPSLDDFAGAPMLLNLESLAAPPVAPEEANRIPEMFMHWTAMHEFMEGKSSGSDASTTISRDEEQASLATPPSGLSDDEGESQKDTSATLKISLTDTLGLWSIGSAAHETGTCKPCAFLWKDLKRPGCQNGRECVFCHLCPPGEVKARKKQKMFMRKVAKNLQYTNQFATGYQPQFEPQYEDQFVAGYGMY